MLTEVDLDACFFRRGGETRRGWLRHLLPHSLGECQCQTINRNVLGDTPLGRGVEQEVPQRKGPSGNP